VLIDLVIGISDNGNTSLALDASLTLLSDAELIWFTRSRLCWNVELTSSRWSWNALLLRLTYWLWRRKVLQTAFKLECESTQARVLMINIIVVF